jgi:hypothetical protein
LNNLAFPQCETGEPLDTTTPAPASNTVTHRILNASFI